MREFFLAARTFVLAASDYECGGLVVLFLPGKEMIVGRRLLAHSPSTFITTHFFRESAHHTHHTTHHDQQRLASLLVPPRLARRSPPLPLHAALASTCGAHKSRKNIVVRPGGAA